MLKIKKIYAYAQSVVERETKISADPTFNFSRFAEVCQDAFLRWWGWVPPEEIIFMGRFLSNKQKKFIPIKRELKGMENFRIGFDITQAITSDGGCGFFAYNLLRNLFEMFPRDEFILYPFFGTSYCDDQHVKHLSRVNRPNVHYALSSFNASRAKRFWENLPAYALTCLGVPDVVHANNFFCPRLCETKIVYTLYDMSVFDCPEYHSSENIRVCREGINGAVKNADMIVAISRFSRERFLKYYPEFPHERIKYVPLGSRFKVCSPVKRVAGLVPNGFWLSVATLEPRKNIRGLLIAYLLMKKKVIEPRPLVLVGKKGWSKEYTEKVIKEFELEETVRTLGFVPDAELCWLYQNCFAMCYPSYYEGFGLPVIEALSQGAAVITSCRTSLPEVGGNAVLYVNPNDPCDIAEKLYRLESDNRLRELLREKAAAQAANFSWHDAAQSIRRIYSEVATMPKRTGGLCDLSEQIKHAGFSSKKALVENTIIPENIGNDKTYFRYLFDWMQRLMTLRLTLLKLLGKQLFAFLYRR